MAEGGEDIPLDPLDPDRGRGRDEDKEDETSFGGDDWTRDSEKYKFPTSHYENQAYEPDEVSPLMARVKGLGRESKRLKRDKEAGEAFFRETFVNPDFRKLVFGLDGYGRYWVKLIRGNAKAHCINKDLSNLDKIRKASKQISDYLGDTKEERLLRNDQIMGQNVETLRQMRQSRRTIKEQEERVKELERRNKKLSKTKNGSNYSHLTSTHKLRETLFNVQYVQVIEFSSSTSLPFVISFGSAQGESNTYFGPVIDLYTGGNGHEFPKVKIIKTKIDVVTCKMMDGNFGTIFESRRNYARVPLRIFHDLPQREMKQRSFFLMLNRSSDAKVMEIDYKLEDPIHDATAIRVHSWHTNDGYDFVSCPLVNPTTETNANEADAHFIAFGMSGNTRDHGTYRIRPTHRTIHTIPIRLKRLQGALLQGLSP